MRYHRAAAFALEGKAVGGFTHHFSEEDLRARAREAGPEKLAAFEASRYHMGLIGKYLEARDRPWLPVAADPPPPPSANPDVAAFDDPFDPDD